MPKISVAEIAARAQKLYNPKDKSAQGLICTGVDLKRPTKPEDFILCPPEHPWRTLTGLQGIPYDIILQVAGAPDSGKTTIGTEFMAFAQKQNVYVVLWDVEKKFDVMRFRKFGGKPEDVCLVTTPILRKGAGAMLKFVRTIMEADPDARIFLVHDSVGGSVSRNRSERELDDEKNTQPGSEAVENSDYMRAVVATFDKYPGRIALLLINQMTDKIGPMPGKSRSGGNKISFHSSMIIEMTRIQDLTKVSKGVKIKTGIISRAKIAKNHLSQTENSVHEMRVLVDAAGWHSVGEQENEEETE